MRKLLIAAGLALAAFAASPASAAPQSVLAAPQAFAKAEALDRLPAEFTRHTREHRHWEIRRNMERQNHYRHRGYGDRRHGYGPPRHAPAHGYRHHRY